MLFGAFTCLDLEARYARAMLTHPVGCGMTDFEHASIVLCPDGPMLLRGDHEVLDVDGKVHRTVRPVTAVCMCGGSAIKPWCDGTHRLLAEAGRGDQTTG